MAASWVWRWQGPMVVSLVDFLVASLAVAQGEGLGLVPADRLHPGKAWAMASLGYLVVL